MTNKFEVTLSDLRRAGACYDGYNKLVCHLSGMDFSEHEYRESYIHYRHDEPIPIRTILDSNGIQDALWACKCVVGADRDLRLYAVWCVRQVQYLMTDPRSIAALDVAERYANGDANDAELAATRAAAGAAASSATRAAALAAATAAAWAAAGAAARDAASSAARASATAAALAAATDAATDATRAAAWAAARDAQTTRLAEMLDKGEF